MALALTICLGENKGVIYGFDDCCVKTDEEVQEILDNCGEICARDEINQMLRKQAEEASTDNSC